MRSKKKQLIMIGAMLLAVILVIAAVAIYHNSKMESLRNSELEKLERDIGLYDDQSIVLQNTSKEQAKKLADVLDAKLRITKDGKFATLTLPEGTTIRDIYAQDESLQYISAMSADYQVSLCDLTDTEEEYGDRLPKRPQYTVTDPDYELQTYLDYLNMGSVWNSYTGSGVRVAVIDSGIDTDHPEFAGRISEYSYNASEDKVVKNFTLEDGSYDWSLIEDAPCGHGTSVTGVIAAAMDGSGIVGIAPDVEIIMIKVEVTDCGKIARASDLVFGIYYAIEQDVQVINMSFGGYDNFYDDVLQLAYDSDVICVAAAGNDATSALHYPSANKNVIGVGALGKDSWELADYSNYGENLNMVAPGTTYTTVVGGGYKERQGTSLSTPVVTAAVALLLQARNYQTFDDVTEVLYASCCDLGDLGRDWYYGFGALDVHALTLEERGTITYEMLTDEVENLDGVFIQGHSLQEMPEPERLYAVFDGWYYDDTYTQKFNYYEDEFYADVTLYAKWANEDDGVPYTYVLLADGTIEICSYTGHRRYITIPEKIEGRVVSSIGSNAFRGQSELREVGLPSGLTRIGTGAFLQCSNLTSIEIPENVIEIGENAFADNVRLSSVGFMGNSKLEVIGVGAFQGCSRLERIELPASLRSVNATAFYADSALESITVQKGNTYFCAIDGVLYNYSGNTLVAYPISHGANYALPEHTTTIGEYAFALSNIRKIDLVNVAWIERNAFAGSALEEVDIPDTVTALGEFAFGECEYLTQINLGSGVQEIPEGAFYKAELAKEITIPENVKAIGEGAFGGCGFEKVTFAQNCQLIWIGKQAFVGCNIRQLSIPALVLEIGSKAFADNPLQQIAFAEDCVLQAIGDYAFSGDSLIQTIELPASLRSIGEGAFEATGLTEVTIPAGVIALGPGVFASCTDLTAIAVEAGNTHYRDIDGVLYDIHGTYIHTFPAGKQMSTYILESTVREVYSHAFTGVDKVRTIILPEGLIQIGVSGFESCGAYSYTMPSTLTQIEARAFKGNSNLRSIQLPQSLEHIGEMSFSGCTNLRMIDIPDNVVNIGRYAFSGNWNMNSIIFGENSKLYRIGFAALADTGIQNLTVPASVTAISQYAFEGCRYLNSITFASNSKLESITAFMFDGCTNLNSITFESGSALTNIQAHAFDGMDKLVSIDFGDAKIINVDNFAFRFCKSLSAMDLAETVTSIGRYAFYGCESLSELTLPAQLEHIECYAFLGTDDLELYFLNETLPLYLDENWDYGIKGYYTGVASVAEKGNYRYATLTSGNIAILKYLGEEASLDLSQLDLGAPISIIGGSAFKDSAVKELILPDTLTTIQAEAFRYADLESVTIPANVTFIGRAAFAHSDIASVTFAPNSKLSVIEQCAFEGTKNLISVSLPASLTTMGTGVFLKSGLQSVTFAEGIHITEIPRNAFAETRLNSVSLPDSVVLVDHNAFDNVRTLQSVSFGDNEGIRLMSNAFYRTGLTSLHIPANVTYIGEYCFVALNDLTAFSVDASNPNYKAVGGLLFNKTGRKLITVPAGRTGSLTVPEGVEEIGFGAFEESKLSAILFHEDTNILTFGYRAFFKANGLTSVTIPESVVSIDYYAFGYCENLREVVIAQENRLKGIYEGAFIGCNSLENITIPDSVVEISDFAFYGCSKINELPISKNNKIKGIYDYAFAYTGINGEVTMPDTLIDIGDYAFLGTKLTKVTIPNTNMKSLVIGIGAFEDCDRLTEITLPFIGASFEDETITWFGYIFGAGSYEANPAYVPESLQTVNITGNITFIGIGGFDGCASLEMISLPDSISALWNNSFRETEARYTLTQPITLYSKGDELGYGYFGYGICGDLVLAEGITEISNYGFSGCRDLNSILLPEGITKIGYAAFRGCASLKNITLPDSLTTLDRYAFEGCTALEEITIPDGVNTIGEYTFNCCINLKKVVIGDGVTTIGGYAFSRCEQLKEVAIGKNVTSISYNVFQYCSSLEQITIPDSVDTMGSGVFRYCTALKTVDLPETMTSLDGEVFFGCSSLTSVKIPQGVTNVGIGMFDGCRSLVSVTIPDSVTSIGNNAFQNCESLTGAVIPDNVTSIGLRAFYNCAKLESVNIPECVTSIGDAVFGGCAGLQGIIIPDSVTTIGSGAFSDCIGLTSVSLPDNVTNIGSAVFSGCTNLRSVELGGGLPIIGVEMFRGCVNLEQIVLPDSITSIGNGAFRECTGLKKVNIPDGVTTIDNYAFYQCRSLEDITIPDSVTTLGDYVCYACSSLKQIGLGNGVTKIGYMAFAYCSVAELVIPDSVVSIDTYAFWMCSSMLKLTLGANVTTISNDAFRYCDSLGVVINRSNLELVVGDGTHGYVACYAYVVIDKDGNKAFKDDTYFMTDEGLLFRCWNETYTLYAYLGDGDTVTLPATINGSGYRIERFRGAKHVIISEGMTEINAAAFEDSGELETIVLPGGLLSIGDSAFRDCGKLTGITIPEGVASIGAGAFNGCSSLTSITIPNSVTSVGTNAFSGSINVIFAGDAPNFIMQDGILYPADLSTIVYVSESAQGHISLPNGLTAIRDNAFRGCANITGITIPDSVITIGQNAFSGCTGLSSVRLPKNVNSISPGAFANCVNLTEVILPENLTSIGSYAFEGCTALREINLPDGVSTIGNRAFRNCTGLTSIILPDGVTDLGAEVFDGCTSLKEIILSENSNFCFVDGILYDNPVTKVLWVSQYISGDVTILNGVTSIDDWFRRNSELTSVTFPNSVTSVGMDAFEGCTGLKMVTLGSGLQEIGMYAFYGCTSLTEVTMTGGVSKIGSGAFYNCASLESLTIPEGTTTLGDRVFMNCQKLNRVVLPDSLSAMGEGVFDGCLALEEIVIGSNNTSYCFIDGILYNKPITRILWVSRYIPENVVIADGVTEIDGYLFSFRDDLISVSLPDSVQSIGASAFTCCYQLQQIRLPEGLISIGASAFASCYQLQQIRLPEGLTSIGTSAFSDSGLRYVQIPNNVTTIGERAFANCSGLYKVKLSASVTTICDGAFVGCPNLLCVENFSQLSLSFGSSENGSVAFDAQIVLDASGIAILRDDSWLMTDDYFLFNHVNGQYTLRGYLGDEETVTLPVNVNGSAYKTYCFFGAKHVIVPEGVTEIDDEAFHRSPELESIVIPEGVIRIGGYAIANCPNLVSISLPDSLETIGSWAFSGNDRLYSNPEHYYGGMLVANGWIIDVDADTQYLVNPSNIRGVLTFAYEDCSKLKSAVYSNADYAGYLSNVETLCLVEISSPLYGYNQSATLKNIVICNSVGAADLRNCPSIFTDIFYPITDVVIFVEALEDELRWDDNFPGWSNGNRVYYGDEWHWVNFYDENGNVIYSEPRLNSQVIRIPVHKVASDERYSYEISGWDLDCDGKSDSLPATSVVDINAWPVVVSCVRNYTVQFMDKATGVVYDCIMLPYGAQIDAPAEPEKQGYDFIGWRGLTDGMMVTGDSVIYALWQHHGNGHTYTEPVWIEATCSEPGYYRHVCSICGEYYGTDYADPLGHDYHTSVVEPSCSVSGYVLYSCSRCGDNYHDQLVDPMGHDYGEWNIAEKAQCEKQGVRYCNCIVCGNREEESIPAVGHTFKLVKCEVSTCTAAGTQVYQCVACGMTVTEKMPLENHTYEKKCASKDFVESLLHLSADILWGHEGDGAFFYECTGCGRVMSATEAEVYGVGVETVACRHTTAVWTTERLPDCKGQGVQICVCNGCQEVLCVKTYGETLNHSYVDGVCSVCGDVCISITQKGRTLNYEDLIYVIDIFELIGVEGIDLTKDAGLLIWSVEEFEALSEIAFDADHAKVGLSPYKTTGFYSGSSDGIFTRDLHEEAYYVGYVKLADGSYIYSEPKLYSPAIYAHTMLGKDSTSDATKELCVALLNYISAAQVYFHGTPEEELVNYALTDEQKALVWNDEITFNLAPEVPADKQVVRDESVFTGTGKNLLFEEMISIVSIFRIDDGIVADAKESGTIYWTAEQFAALDGAPGIDNMGNGTKVALSQYRGNAGQWCSHAPEVAAKDMADTQYYYLGYVVHADGSVSYSGVISYTVEQYIYNKINDADTSGTMLDFAQRLYYYERAAKRAIG